MRKSVHMNHFVIMIRLRPVKSFKLKSPNSLLFGLLLGLLLALLRLLLGLLFLVVLLLLLAL